jgi:hypothetical protein
MRAPILLLTRLLFLFLHSLLQQRYLQLQIWQARPSGHSVYFTVVGVFDSSENAKEAKRILREALQEKDRWKEVDWDQEEEEEASLELT